MRTGAFPLKHEAFVTFSYQLFYLLSFCSQKSCIDFVIGARPLERYMPKQSKALKHFIWRIVVSDYFEYFIMMLIVCNTVLLMMKVSSPRKSRWDIMVLGSLQNQPSGFQGCILFWNMQLCSTYMLSKNGDSLYGSCFGTRLNNMYVTNIRPSLNVNG